MRYSKNEVIKVVSLCGNGEKPTSCIHPLKFSSLYVLFARICILFSTLYYALQQSVYFYSSGLSGSDESKKKVREKSRECHNHIPQPFPDTKRKRKPIKPNKHKSIKRVTVCSGLFVRIHTVNAVFLNENIYFRYRPTKMT